MRYFSLFIGLMCLAAAHGCSPSTPSAPQQAVNPVAPDQPQDLMTARNITLNLYDSQQPPDVAQKPQVTVRANTFTLLEEGIYAIQDANATIFNQDETKEDITLEASEGTVDQNKGAILRGGVKVFVGDLVMDLEDFEWQNSTAEAPGQAWSDKKVILKQADMELEAQGLKLYPDRQQFILEKVSGIIWFGREQ